MPVDTCASMAAQKVLKCSFQVCQTKPPPAKHPSLPWTSIHTSGLRSQFWRSLRCSLLLLPGEGKPWTSCVLQLMQLTSTKRSPQQLAVEFPTLSTPCQAVKVYSKMTPKNEHDNSSTELNLTCLLLSGLLNSFLCSSHRETPSGHRRSSAKAAPAVEQVADKAADAWMPQEHTADTRAWTEGLNHLRLRTSWLSPATDSYGYKAQEIMP